MLFCPAPIVKAGKQPSAIALLTGNGLTANLQFCLDAGDSASLPAASTKWLDRSGNGQDFFRGTDATAQASDPTINGTAGGLSSAEYLGFDGGDLLTLDEANPAWVNALHKDNAALTMGCWVWSKAQAGSSPQQIFGSLISFSTDTGVDCYIGNDGAINFIAWNSGDIAFAMGSGGETNFVSDDAWTFIGISIDEAAGEGHYQLNATANSESLTVGVSPDTGNSSGTLSLGARPGSSNTFDSGSRMAQLFIASRAWSAAELALYFNLSRGRYGV